MEPEKRFSNIQHEQGEVSGYAIKWGVPSFIDALGKQEVFERGSLETPRAVILNSQHDASKVLGSTKSKTLLLEEDETGLKFKCKLPKSALATREGLSRGDLSGASIEFYCKEDDLSQGFRKIKKAELQAISLVTDPAHETPIAYRSKEPLKQKRKWTDLL